MEMEEQNEVEVIEVEPREMSYGIEDDYEW
jgi:hypothetical protein